jgi:hypothetical protein
MNEEDGLQRLVFARMQVQGTGSHVEVSTGRHVMLEQILLLRCDTVSTVTVISFQLTRVCWPQKSKHCK